MRFVALLLLILLLPILLAVGLLLFVAEGKPILFRQDRIGYKRRTFTIYKFRSMSGGKISPTGRWIRKLGLDELPQLWNIVRGEMALVGPRPLTQEDIVRLEWDSAEFDARWDVKPGITCTAQLSSICSAQHSIEEDLRYVEQQTFFYDLSILFRTALVPITGKRTN